MTFETEGSMEARIEALERRIRWLSAMVIGLAFGVLADLFGR